MKKEYYLNELKTKLYNEVGRYLDYKKEVEKEETKCSFLEEILVLLSEENIYDVYENRFHLFTLLEYAFDKNEYDYLYDRLSRIIYRSFDKQGNPVVSDEEILDNLSVFREVIAIKYGEEADNLNDMKYSLEVIGDLTRNYRSIHTALKQGYELTGAKLPLIIEFMEKKGFSQEKQILIQEAIKSHNIKAHKNLEEAPSSYVEKIMNTNLHKFYIPSDEEEEFEATFYSVAESFYKLFGQVSLAEFTSFIDYLPKAESGYTAEQFKYIYRVFLNMIIDDIFTCVDDMSKLEVYNDKELRNMTIDSYAELIKKYYGVFNLFKQELVKYHEDIKDLEDTTEEIEETETPNYVNRLVYMSSNGVSKLEKGLKYIPKEYYERVQELLERKKKGTLPSKKDSVMKKTNDKLAGFGKLEDDQVRMLYKPLGNNIYMIIGGFVKKDTKDFTGYYSLASEYNNTKFPPIEELLEESHALEKSLNTYIEENKRKKYR